LPDSANKGIRRRRMARHPAHGCAADRV